MVKPSPDSRWTSPFQHERAYARVSRVGRWTWRIRVLVPVANDDLGDATIDTVNVLGRKRAERIARRLVTRHIRKYAWRNGSEFEVREGDLC